MIPKRWKPSLMLSRFLPKPSSADVTKYILFAKQRSGSTWVIDLLNSHPEIVGYSELFDYDCWGDSNLVGGECRLNWNGFVTEFHSKHGREPSRVDQVSMYSDYLNHHGFAAEKATVVGFKLMYNQAISHPAIPRYLLRHRVRCVHLIRRNHLDGIVSHEAVANRGFAHAGTKAESQSTYIDPASIALRLQRRAGEVEAAREFARFLGLPTIELYYEDLCEDINEMQKVLSFLTVDPEGAVLNSSLRKMSGSSHQETISNFDEVASALRGTPFEQLLRG